MFFIYMGIDDKKGKKTFWEKKIIFSLKQSQDKNKEQQWRAFLCSS